MKKYHIGKNGEVNLCEAKQRCRFGGDSGVENHFNNKAEAEASAQETFSQDYGNVSTVSKKPLASDFNSLAKFGKLGIPVSRISSMRTHNFSAGNSEISRIDVTEERFTPTELSDIRSGKLIAFS